MVERTRWSAAPESVAAVDLGSNSFHLAIARVVGGSLTIVDGMKEQVQLAAGLETDKRITDEAWERAIATLERFGERLRDTPQMAVRAVGTDTLRVAKNSREFLDAASQALGHPIEVISGPEEARLIYRGVVHDLPHEDGKRQLVVDIGGGSTEFIIGAGLDPKHLQSLHMGCVSYTRRFFPNGKLKKERYRKARIAAQLELERLRGPFFKGEKWERAVGSSGTINAIHAIIRDNGWGADITADGIAKLRETILAFKNSSTLTIPGLSERRQGVIAGGLAILDAIFETLPITSMSTSSVALREGVMYDFLGRFSQSDVREATTRQLMQQFQIDTDQAERVARTAQVCLGMTDWFPEAQRDDAQAYLGWAARLHEIGLAISFHGYHKHGAYMIAHSTMPGFSRDEQQILGALVLLHRRKLNRPELNALPRKMRLLTKRLAVLLRLAVRLNRNRSWRPPPDVALKTDGDRIEATFPEGYLEAHPLTQADLEEEAARVAAAGMELVVT